MKKLAFIAILLLTFIVGCGGNTTTSSTVTTTTNSNTTSKVYAEPSFEFTFNDQNILYRTKRIIVDDGYTIPAVYYHAGMYEELLEEEHTKMEYNDNNSLKFKSSEPFSFVLDETLYKLQYDGDKLISVITRNYLARYESDSIDFSLPKEDNVVGYYLELTCPYPLSDLENYVYYLGAMVLFI